jgi:hypothetical protein
VRRSLDEGASYLRQQELLLTDGVQKLLLRLDFRPGTPLEIPLLSISGED